MDPKRFKAPYIPRDRIWQEADGLRARFACGAIIPVNVLDMAEFDLGLEIVPADGLRERCDTEAILLGGEGVREVPAYVQNRLARGRWRARKLSA